LIGPTDNTFHIHTHHWDEHMMCFVATVCVPEFSALEPAIGFQT
jgi:hypothetical protein